LDINPQQEAFGPVSGSETTHFRFSSRHSAVSSPPAYAVIDGLVLAQSVDDTHINLILKPLQAVFNGLPPIAYFIYRGVRRDSLVSDDKIAAADRNHLTAVIWEAHAALKSSIEEATGEPFEATPTPSVIGLGSALPPESRVDAFFAHPPDGVIPTLVRAGWHIGAFGTDFAIEIVLDSIHHPLTMAAVRILDHVLEIPSSDGTPSGDVAHLYARQQVFSYLDPCVFFSTPDEITATVNGAPQTIPSAEILSLFLNRHTIYLDIRDQHGLSLSLSSDYGTNVLLDTGSGKQQVALDRDWAMPRLTFEDFASMQPNEYVVAVAFPVGENTVPIACVKQAGTWQFSALEPTDDGFTTSIDLITPALTIDGETGPRCSYIRILYGRGFDWAAFPRPSHDRVLYSNHVLDNLPLALYDMGNAAVRVYYQPRYVDDLHTLAADGVFATGVAVDETHVIFFTFPIQENLENGHPPGLTDRNQLQDQFLTQLAPGTNAPILVRNKLALDTETSTLLLLSSEDSGFFAPDWSTFFSIAFTKPEFEALQASATAGFLAGFPVYIGLVVEDREFDQLGQYYETYRVVLRGYTHANGGLIIEEISTDAIVHTAAA
jgi:hypothetical protein